MNWALPESIEIQGVAYLIRTDYRCVLDILTDLSDPEADGQERALAVLIGLYPDFDEMPPEHYEDAIQAGLQFINCDSDDAPHKSPRLVDWEQDFTYIVAPINRVTRQEVRAVEYMHWWTFLLAYYEIGDCTFAQIVRIRDLRARGKPLDKTDQDWYNRNRRLVDFKRKYTEQDEEKFSKWLR